jgi:hypothetical protein
MTPHVAVSVLLRSFSRILAGVLLALVVLVAIGAIVVAQASRDEAVTNDTAVLMVDGTPTGRDARVDRAVRLWLAGDIVRMVLAGAQTAEARDALLARGIVADRITEVNEETQIAQLVRVQQVLEEMRITDAMLVGEPVEALRLLKIARDHGLELHSVPAGADTAISLDAVVDEVGRYLAYCFVGR